MTQLKYVVKGVPPGKKKRVIYCEFGEEDWQWAEKTRAYLEDKGVRRVTVEEQVEDQPENP